MERSSNDGAQSEAPHQSDLATQSLAFYTNGTPAASRHQQWLQRTIETEVIPRLMLAHRLMASATSPSVPAFDSLPDQADVDAFTALLLSEDDSACDAFVVRLRNRPVALENIFLNLFSPSARLLGVMWEDDVCDFTQVTLGLWRIQKMVFELGGSDAPHHTERRIDPPLRVMLVAVPGSHHTLGLTLVSEFFRMAGWEVFSESTAEGDELTEIARRGWFDVIGVSASLEEHIQPLQSFITRLRAASRNPGVGIMVGGPIFLKDASLVGSVGADFTAIDARQAVEFAESFACARQQQK